METRVGPTDLGRHPSAQLLAEQQRMIRRMLHLPRLGRTGEHDPRRQHPPGRRARATPLQAVPVPQEHPGQVRRTGAVLLRPDKPPLHPRSAPGQEHRRPVPGARLRGVHDRLGDPRRRRPRSDHRGLRLPFRGRRRHPHRRPPRPPGPAPAGLLHGGDADGAVFRPQPRAHPQPHAAGRAHRLRQQGLSVEPVDRCHSFSTSMRSSTATATARPGFCRLASRS